MKLETEVFRLPYQEHRAINELMHAHFKAYQGRLRAMIAFGDLVIDGSTFDIDLLEIVEGWPEPTFVEYASSNELPLRGRLRLYVLPPQDFESLDHITDEGRKAEVEGIMARVQRGREIILEDPPGYALRVLTQTGANKAIGFQAAGLGPLSPPPPPTVKAP